MATSLTATGPSSGVSLADLIDATSRTAAAAVEPSAKAVGSLRHRSSAGSSTIEVTDICHDSRAVDPGAMYCAIPGQNFDGHDFAAAAVERGAASLLVERELPGVFASSGADVAQLVVSNVRQAMPWFARTLHDNPSADIDVVGVTGTNGKTTTTHLLADIAFAANVECEVIGTLSGAHTTPEAPLLQAQLRAAADNGCGLVAIEVSSHALDQYRTDGTNFAVAAFTNLSRDHLDYHETMDDYFEAKAALFDGRAQAAVINVDDPAGARLAERVTSPIMVRPSSVEVRHIGTDGSAFMWQGQLIELPLAGRFNIANALIAAEAALVLAYPVDAIVEGLSTARRVPGRMDAVPGLPEGSPAVLVDYSHTPDGLEKALAAARETTTGRLVVVFGAGGDRDRTKRPVMGAVAEAGADLVVVTSDNPRSEDQMAIIGEILDGMSPESRQRSIVEPDRRAAIAAALDHSTTGDVVIVAGKGHESTQTIGDVVTVFDDRQVVADVYGVTLS